MKTVVGPLVVDLLRSELSVVMDFQANTRVGRDWFRALFQQADAEHILHFIDTQDAECLVRIAKRNIERPEGSHHLTEEVFAYVSSFFEEPAEAEGFNVQIHVPSDQ